VATTLLTTIGAPEGILTIDDSKRVLIVDDDDAIRTMVERVLRREAFEVDSARDGFEAIEKLAQNDYVAILLDLMMPRVDGLGVLQFLERYRPELSPAVIVMSANVPGATDAMREGRVSRVLSKPFDLNEMLEYVRGQAAV
jgi:DNA-binding NtrC family response regulator